MKMNCVKTTVAIKPVYEDKNHLPICNLSIACKCRPTSKNYSIYNKYLLSLKGYRFGRCNFVKVYIFL